MRPELLVKTGIAAIIAFTPEIRATATDSVIRLADRQTSSWVASTMTPEMGVVEKDPTLEEALSDVWRFTQLERELPPLDRKIDQDYLQAWVHEVVPWFEDVGITDKAILPDTLTFKYYLDAKESHHVIGDSNCGNKLNVNDRVEDTSVSPWRDDLEFEGTIVHELTHVQQGDICYEVGRYNRSLLETSAQVGMIDVLSAMSLSGNKAAHWAFIHEMREISEDAAYYIAMRQHRTAEFFAFMNAISTPLEQAREQRAQNFWADKQDDLEKLLDMYGYEPYKILINAHKYHQDQAIGLLLPHPDIALHDFGYLMTGNHLERITEEYMRQK